MFYRRAAQLGLEGMLHLALKPEGTSCRVREIAAELGVPATYLAKVMQGLTRVGLLRAMRGPGGGVQLARPAQNITLWQVLTALEPVAEFERCFLHTGRCNELRPCAMHESWAPLRDQIQTLLQRKTLRDLAVESQRNGSPNRDLRLPATHG